MNRVEPKVLILDDEDMNCNSKTKPITSIGINDIGLNSAILVKYDMVFYQGRKGCKLLKSKFTATGVIS